MARRHGSGRGTRFPRGIFSVYTPSGNMMSFNAGMTSFAGGASVSITHGFSTLHSFTAQIEDTGASLPLTVHVRKTAITSAVSAGVYISGVSSSLKLLTSGASIYWSAFGEV